MTDRAMMGPFRLQCREIARVSKLLSKTCMHLVLNQWVYYGLSIHLCHRPDTLVFL